MSGALLFPNLGGEEDRDWQQLQREPAIASCSWLWSLLFGPADRLYLSPHSEHPNPNESEFSPFASAPEGPVFPWLCGPERMVAWLPDTSASTEAKARGLALDAPEWDTVSRVHDKAFAHRLAEREGYLPRPLRGLIRVLEPGELSGPNAANKLLSEIDGWPTFAKGRFVLKPRFGSSARGRVSGAPTPSAKPALQHGMQRLARRGGALLEPWLHRCGDSSVQLHIDPERKITVLGSLDQVMAPSGRLLAHRGELDSRGRVFSGVEEEEEVREAAAAVGTAAAREGYYGPCGVDAFRFRTDGEESFLRPIVELNARFTVGTIAIGLVRRALHSAKQALDISPGDRAGFLLALDLPSASRDLLSGSAATEGDRFHTLPLSPGDGLRPTLVFSRDPQDLDAVESQIRGHASSVGSE